MARLGEPVGAWLALALALALSPGGAAAPGQDCTGVECPPLENCIEDALEPGACCATCVQRGCACEGYQYYDCLQGGFMRGRVPAGQSYFVDFGSTECSCPPGGGKISCQFMPCPELPPNCIEAVVAADSCPQCGQVGCVHSGRKYAAGHTVRLAPCRACHCPDAGGELICYPLPSCHGDATPGNTSDAEEGDPERHYEDPYSYDQEVAEAEALAVSTKDLIETCCAAGQQWAIDSDECLDIPESSAEGDVCRTAQKHCCVSYLKEKSCMAGVLGAKEGEACGDEDNDTCGVSLYKQCCDCCGLGLRVRAEGQSCESNPNLGYPCNHVMLSCCEGEDPLIVPEVRRPPEPEAAPRRVSEAELASREALSLGTETELPNSLPGDDQDECLLLPGELCQHLCINTVGSYRCACFPGFSLQDDGRTCRPDGGPSKPEATEESAQRPESSQEAPNTIALSVPHPNICQDNGPCKQVCRVVGDAAVCSCLPGFAIMADGVSCEDVDECELGTHNCPAGAVCRNTEGSFHCQARERCLEGFLQDPEGNCVDINECTSLSEPCRSGFNCINTVGSYTCRRSLVICGRGYHASEDGTKCVDVNECETGVHRCGEGQTCHNLPGSYRCDCKPGFQRDAFGRACIDVNECWTSPTRVCQHTCENTLGSYRCSCASGFLLAADGKHCEDVNECEAQRCSQECANIYGSYQCYCRHGYQLAEDGHTCTDIDECTQGAGVLCTFQCINVPGSYQCACPEPGYTITANGRSCKDLDECVLGTHNCSEGETCHNVKGGFRCLRFDCPPNYVRVSEMKCERTQCHDFLECQNAPARITHYLLNFQTGLLVPAHIFRISPAPVFAGDTIALTITRGNEEGYFGTRRLNAYTGVVFLQRAVREPRDFALDVEMKLWRQGSVTTFLAKMHIFFTTFAL